MQSCKGSSYVLFSRLRRSDNAKLLRPIADPFYGDRTGGKWDPDEMNKRAEALHQDAWLF
jgi:hypothetical protein